MTSKYRQDEKNRRQEILLRTHQSIGRPMDSVDSDPDETTYTSSDLNDGLPWAPEQTTTWFSPKWVIVYVLFVVSVLMFILYLDAPYRERRALQNLQAAASLGLTTSGESVLTYKVSGKATRVASDNDDYPRVGRRNVMRNIFPTRYLMINGSAERYYIPRWLMFFLSDDELKNAKKIAVEYDARPRVDSLMLGKTYRYYYVTALTVDGKSYFSPTTTYGTQDSIIWLLLGGGLCTILVLTYRRYKRAT